MADDIDDLLDEVENKYCNNKKRQDNATPKMQQSNVARKPNVRTKEEEDLNSIIEDIIDGPEPPDVQYNSQQTASTTGSQTVSSKKCFPLFLGGSMSATGLATTLNKRSCDKLRCTDCDFNVSMFDNYQWHGSTDYLFLRNNMPDFPKLSPKLLTRKGLRAYACQCKWRSVRELTEVQRDSELNHKWVCGKH